MRRFFAFLLSVCTLLMFVSCVPEQNETNDAYTFTDALENTVFLSPDDKIAACHASFADCWLLAGGTLTGATSDAAEDHGLDIGNAAIIGTAKTVNTEALVSSGATVALLSADLAAHLTLQTTLEGLGIRCIYLKVDTFSDYDALMTHFCAATGRNDLYETHVTSVRKRIETILSKIPTEESRTVLLMRAYSSGIKAKSDDNLAGRILQEYGVNNIADAHPSLLEDMSLEHIVSEDPDFIFVLTMGSEEAALAYLRENIESNPAFASLNAVQNGNYHILPKDLFHYKPNERWDESYEYLAKILYPEIFT
ncbi:MAG: ABC transporter substrate-binding protein [Clostridia bacterium]|nr:ABC transporter substrate-binding protein [Clostridia bacterium]